VLSRRKYLKMADLTINNGAANPHNKAEQHSESVILEIEQLITLRSTLKQEDKYDDADEIQRQLWEEPYFVKLFDHKIENNGSNKDFTSNANGENSKTTTTMIRTIWKPRLRIKREPRRLVAWDELDSPFCTTTTATAIQTIPFLIGTVDNPTYQARYERTIQHLNDWQKSTLSHLFKLEPCFLLDVQQHSGIGVKKILYEGWRQKLVPQLMQLLETAADHSPPFVLIGEDDIRMPPDLTSSTLYRICGNAFESHPELNLLSLGHSWKALTLKNRQRQQTTTPVENYSVNGKQKQPNSNHKNLLLDFLQSTSAGVHASTLFCIRLPRGVYELQRALDLAAQRRKQTHLDQFLFYSVYHNLALALCDPPLVGWADVDVTLTKSKSGHRRRGGGRLGYLPPSVSKHIGSDPISVSWVRRQLVVEDNG